MGMYKYILRDAKIGQNWSFNVKINDIIVHKSGRILEMNDEILILQFEEKKIYLNPNDINSGEELQIDNSISNINITQRKLPIQVVETIVEPQKTICKKNLIIDTPLEVLNDSISTQIQAEKKDYPKVEDLELLFIDEPILEHFNIQFDIKDVSKKVKQKINKWKNRYDYAIKIKEYYRLNDDIKGIECLAKSQKNSMLFCLAGDFALKSRMLENEEIAINNYKTATEMGNYSSAFSLTSIMISNKKYAKAATYLVTALLLKKKIDENSILTLGRCLVKTGIVKIENIGQLLYFNCDSKTKELLSKIIALMVNLSFGK